jgi:hypothetical protein
LASEYTEKTGVLPVSGNVVIPLRQGFAGKLTIVFLFYNL